MKLPDDIKCLVKQKLERGEMPEQDEIVRLIEPYLKYDPDEEFNRYKARVAQRLIASFKSPEEDGTQVRDVFSFELDGQMRWAHIYFITNVEVLKAQRIQLINKWKGLHKSIQKINRKLTEMGSKQPISDTILDHLMDKEMEKETGSG